MLKRCIKLGASGAYFVALAALRRYRSGEAQRLITLYYHGVSAAQRPGFIRQLETLARLATVVPADWVGHAAQARLLVAITFDDALTSVFDNALPELERRGFHCTIFVPSGKLGGFPDWMMEEGTDKTDPVVDARRIQRSLGPLVAVGSHGVNHVHMTQIPIQAAQEEIRNSRMSLEELSGGAVQSFSFPYGDHSDELVTMCRHEGYTKVFLISPERVNPGVDTLVRGRVSVDPDDWAVEFFLKISGAYEWLANLQSLKRALKAKASSALKSSR
jgi:peptidoglycan/xylan/chitin deacetylase (PgdA/CDA1 family)